MKDKGRWLRLCEQAAIAQDSTKLLELVKELNLLLAEKEARLEANRTKNDVLDSEHEGKDQ